MKCFKVLAYSVSLLILFLSVIIAHPSQAQVALDLFEAYPQRGGLGETVSMLLRGDGFESINNLDGVFVSGTQLRDRDFNILSNELIEILLFIPENTPVGPTEIRFVFDDIALDAAFEVTEGSAESLFPVISAMDPKEGQADTDMSLFAELNAPVLARVLFSSLGWGGFVNMIIGGVEVTVNSTDVSDEGDLVEYRIYLPPETPPGETEVHLYYENYSYRDFFFVAGQVGDPVIFTYTPNEAPANSEIEFILEGENLNGLGELVGIEIGGVDISIQDYGLASNQVALVRANLPPDLPDGETWIVFYFGNYGYEDTIFVIGGEVAAPFIRRMSPREAELGTEVEFFLEGQNLYELGGLLGVEIAGRNLPVLDNWEDSNERAVVWLYLPPELPEGEHGIVFFYENYGFEDGLLLRRGIGGEREIVIRDFSPREGEIDSDFDLYLEGENLYDLGELIGISVGGIDLDVWEYEFESDQRLWVNVYMPEETPLNQQPITFYFENWEHDDSFIVNEPSSVIPPEVLIFVIGGVGLTGAILIYRAIQKGKDREIKKSPTFHVKPEVDLGKQTVYPERSPLTLDIDLKIKVESDIGGQKVYAEGHKLVADE